MRAGKYDVVEWIKKIKSLGYDKFTMRDLDGHNLRKDEYLKKASYYGLIRKIGMEDRISVWRIVSVNLNR